MSLAVVLVSQDYDEGLLRKKETRCHSLQRTEVCQTTPVFLSVYLCHPLVYLCLSQSVQELCFSSTNDRVAG